MDAIFPELIFLMHNLIAPRRSPWQPVSICMRRRVARGS
jgi:hypothetical protein